ncbi:hypothetical protein EVAR_62676_1 [Eumeta japonica]|uniref:Uncharacterized protein n=1 Tax=Eumeta variegata TaxID=151549 RepID=A0A4C1Z2K7_EUMVA|nr:hypothetical protein EVAR_62676_1 [Eumeta japonica]
MPKISLTHTLVSPEFRRAHAAVVTRTYRRVYQNGAGAEKPINLLAFDRAMGFIQVAGAVRAVYRDAGSAVSAAARSCYLLLCF